MKICFKCEEEQPFIDFYKHKQMADGYLGKCKRCTKADASQHRSDNLERIREYDRRRGNRQPEGYSKEYAKRFPQKYKSQTAVNNAVRDNRLLKATECEDCSSKKFLHGHHDDYSKPLEVRWLCAACHHQWHAKNGPGKNPF